MHRWISGFDLEISTVIFYSYGLILDPPHGKDEEVLSSSDPASQKKVGFNWPGDTVDRTNVHHKDQTNNLTWLDCGKNSDLSSIRIL